MEGQNPTNDELEVTSNENGETTSQDQTETEENQLEGDEALTLTRAELDEREREIRRDQDKRWKERLKGFEESKGDSKESDQKGSQVVDDRYDRLELKIAGVASRDDQDFVLDYARQKKLSIDEALSSRVVRAELAAMKEESEKKRATTTPGNRVGKPAEKDASYWLAQVEAGKQNSPDPAMRKKVRALLDQKLQRGE
jgi:hypothetical protein